MTAGPRDITSVGDALEGLVHQFADRWAFLRELVQNAIDAGTAELDVRIDHDPARGQMTIEVADHGEGMNREIIDTRLTRLFSSTKEGDYTKIGRFGIGFVSVFALDPDLVCVDTGRAGEWWRVLFRRDRSFERIRLHHPVEGTTVRLFRAATEADVAEARERARATLEYWCKHARIDVRLDGDTVSGPMDLDGLCKAEHREEDTHLVMALVPEPVALRGYYHGGLTLHEERDDSLPHVAFKIDSRFLEHTLTRDDVIRDENFAKAMAIVGRVARTRLAAALFDALEQRAAAGDDPDPAGRETLLRAAARHLAGDSPDPAWQARAIVPCLAAPPASLADLRARPRASKLYRAAAASPVVDRLVAAGHRVVACAAGDALDDLLAAALGDRPLPADALCTAVPLDPRDMSAWTPLCGALTALLAARKSKVAGVTVGRLAYPGSPVATRAAISQVRPFELTPVAEIDALAGGWLTSGRTLVLSADHDALRSLRRVAAHEPELAAYLALKSFFLHGELSSETDAELATLAAEARWRRTDT